MKSIYTLLFTFFISITALNAQTFTSGTITQNDNTVTQGRLAILSSENKVLLKDGFNTRSISMDQISSVTLGERSYEKINVNNKTVLAHSLVSGKASLSHLGGDNYLILKEDGVSRLLNISKNTSQLPGELAVLFGDCNSLRDNLFKTDEFNESTLIDYSSQYNNCDYSAYSPTEKEVKWANSQQPDKARFYAGAGVGFNSVSFFDSSDTEGLTGFGIQVGVMVSPGFLGKAQGNVHISLEGSANFSGDNDFGNAGTPVNLKVNTYRLLLSTEYVFNKTGTFQPFVGFGIGGTSDSFEGNVNGRTFDISGGNVIYAPKAGVLYKLKNGKHIGLVATYIPDYENDLSFPDGEAVIPLIVNSQYLNIGINYFF